MTPFRAAPTALALIIFSALLTGCSAASSPGGTVKNDAGEVVLDSSTPDATSVAKVDLCAWADQAAGTPSNPVTVSIPENDGSPTAHFVTASTGANTVEEDGEAVKVRCNLLYDDTFAISLKVELSFDPSRGFTPPPSSDTTSDSIGPIQLSGYLG